MNKLKTKEAPPQCKSVVGYEKKGAHVQQTIEGEGTYRSVYILPCHLL